MCDHDQSISSNYSIIDTPIEPNEDMIEKSQHNKATKKRKVVDKKLQKKKTPLKAKEKKKSKSRDCTSDEKKTLAELIGKEQHIWP